MIVGYTVDVPQKRANKCNQIKKTDITKEELKDFFISLIKIPYYYTHYTQSANKDLDVISGFWNKVCKINDREMVISQINLQENGTWLVAGFSKDTKIIEMNFICTSLEDIKIVDKDFMELLFEI